MTRETRTIMLAGVGGQGIILASKILIDGLIRANYDVKSSEVHGMAQRGGSVITQLRYGDKVYSSLVGEGAVDVLFAMEKLEAMRYAHFLKKDGILLMNEMEIPPAPVLIGQVPYPRDVNERLEALPVKFFPIAADIRARELGNVRVVNVIMVGALIKLIGLADGLDWSVVVAAAVKPQYKALNLEAFRAGMELARHSQPQALVV
ncbi:MAG: indolepyruvate oxidoreductase subunit beta [Thermacetogeniaceae bacterium]